MTHYEEAKKAQSKDNIALKAVESLDYKGFISAIEDNHISVCGYGPIGSMLVYSKLRNAIAAKVIKYGTSGDASGDYRSVVAYAAVIVMK